MAGSEAPKKKLQLTDGSAGRTQKSQEVFCGNLPFETTEEDVTALFEEYGTVTRAKLLEGKGIAFITFEDAACATAALEANGQDYNGRALKVNMAGDRPPAAGGSGSGGGNPPNKTIFVRNLSYDSTEESIREAFQECGEIYSVRIPRNPDTDMPRGFCMVEFSDEASAKTAVELAGTEIDGRGVQIDYAQPKGDRSGGDRGGRGGRGGGGGFRGGGGRGGGGFRGGGGRGGGDGFRGRGGRGGRGGGFSKNDQ